MIVQVQFSLFTKLYQIADIVRLNELISIFNNLSDNLYSPTFVKILLLPIAPLYEWGKPPLPSPASTCKPTDKRTACFSWSIKLLIFLLISVSRVMNL